MRIVNDLKQKQVDLLSNSIKKICSVLAELKDFIADTNEIEKIFLNLSPSSSNDEIIRRFEDIISKKIESYKEEEFKEFFKKNGFFILGSLYSISNILEILDDKEKAQYYEDMHEEYKNKSKFN